MGKMQVTLAFLVVVTVNFVSSTHVEDQKALLLSKKEMNNTEGYLKYLIPDISLNWYEARQECRDRGMDLIMLDTQAKNDYMSNQLSGIPEEFWIGASDLDSPGTFYWERTGESFGYTSWLSGEPNNIGEEQCVQMKINDHLWNNHYCDSVVTRFICEIF